MPLSDQVFLFSASLEMELEKLLFGLKLQVDDDRLIESVGEGLLLPANRSESLADPIEIEAIGLRAMLPGVMVGSSSIFI